MSDESDETEEDVVLLNEKGETKASTRKALKEMAKKVDETYTDMGRHLYNAYYGDYWEGWGFESFEEYCMDELGFAERKAKYLIAIWKRFVVDMGVARKKLERIGWTKLSKIVNVVDDKSIEKWLDKARTLRVAELEKEVKKYKGSSDADEDYNTLNFKLAALQAENVEAALATAAAEAGSDKRGHLLDLICTEYQAGHMDPSKKLGWVLKNVQRVYGVKVVALKDPEMFKQVRDFVKDLQAGKKATAPAKKASEPEPTPAAKAEKPAPEEDTATKAPKKKTATAVKKTKVKKAPGRRRKVEAAAPSDSPAEEPADSVA